MLFVKHIGAKCKYLQQRMCMTMPMYYQILNERNSRANTMSDGCKHIARKETHTLYNLIQ